MEKDILAILLEEVMSVGKYMVILPRSEHIRHTFDSFEAAEKWMHNTSSTGFITFVVGKVITKTETKTVTEDIVNYIKNQVEAEV